MKNGSQTPVQKLFFYCTLCISDVLPEVRFRTVVSGGVVGSWRLNKKGRLIDGGAYLREGA